MLRLILLALFIAVLKTPGGLGAGVAKGDEIERGDGTLPLKLPGDGTLPLKLRGDAVQGASRLGTQVTLTSATTAALTGAPAAALICRLTGNVSKHAAQGTVLVGLAQYAIKGICFRQDTSEMEVVATRGSERSSMTGGLVAPEPDSFAGSLTISAATSPATTYSFTMRSVAESLGGSVQ